MMIKISYRDIQKYKYQLLDTYTINTPLRLDVEFIHTRFLIMLDNGTLRIKAGYAWDGCSGPTIDTKTNMRAGLVHDALYQLMRLGFLDYENDRKAADDLFKEILLEDGDPPWRAWYYHRAVRSFAKGSATPESQKKSFFWTTKGRIRRLV